jgi:hypothetical protein
MAVTESPTLSRPTDEAGKPADIAPPLLIRASSAPTSKSLPDRIMRFLSSSSRDPGQATDPVALIPAFAGMTVENKDLPRTIS